MCQQHLFLALLYSLQLLGSKYKVIIDTEAKHTVTCFTSSLMLCMRAFTFYRSGLSHFLMLIQVISLLTEESWHTRIVLPTTTYSIPADPILKKNYHIFLLMALLLKKKKIKTWKQLPQGFQPWSLGRPNAIMDPILFNSSQFDGQ